ncbi:MAG: hypothetical protein OJF50_002573 [Nitrospira sp.]|jgi:hypothetical protein|nr:hypothetical protein [Nitrospira sp.]
MYLIGQVVHFTTQICRTSSREYLHAPISPAITSNHHGDQRDDREDVKAANISSSRFSLYRYF